MTIPQNIYNIHHGNKKVNSKKKKNYNAHNVYYNNVLYQQKYKKSK